MSVTGHRQSASISKRGAESNAAGASRGIAIVADLLTWRPRAPFADSPKHANAEERVCICPDLRERRIGAKNVVFRPGSSAG